VNKPIQNTPYQIKLPLLLTLAIAGGILLGATIFGNNTQLQALANGYAKYKEILNHVNESYVDSVNTEELIDYSIEKMLEKLDPHTVYIPAKDVEKYNMQLESDFDGIGVEFNIFRDTIYVVAPLSGGPSEKVGLQSGDKIVSVDGKDVAGPKIKPDNNKVFEWLRGKRGSVVELGIIRRGVKGVTIYKVTRDKIPSYSVEASLMVNDKVGFIKVSRFGEGTYREFRSALQNLKKEGMQSLILDLRDNPGGYMDRAINMVDELVGGNPKIVYTDGKGSRYDSESRAKLDGLFEEGAVLVLINEGSASASEIVAGALQDNDRALIVGRRSFGKGLVQAPIDLQDGSELRLTISRYYTPSGRSIQKPYESYEKDIEDRLTHGELFNKDSIRYDKSLKYKTSKGRTVYGGGGIVPDYFVPLDSTSYEYLNELYKINLLREYAVEYSNSHKKELQAMSAKGFKDKFEVNEQMLAQIVKLGKEVGVEYKEKEYQKSKPLIKLHLKALIARSIWDVKGYYPIMLEEDDVFQKALQLTSEAEKLAQK
jgi:carboxyl-terminal processing protease